MIPRYDPVKLRIQIEKLLGPEDKQKWKWNPDAIEWEKLKALREIMNVANHWG